MTEPCGCCEPLAPLTPVAVENRPALSAVAYRAGTYAGFRRTMLDAIAAAPELAGLTTRADDDYAVTILDLWAAAADVLTFYTERYANEAFLRTATRRESVLRLAELLGYRPRPGVAAGTLLTFTVEEGRQVAVPVGLRVQSVPEAPAAGASPPKDEPAPLPQTFETTAAILADARLNALRIFPGPSGPAALAAGTTEALLARSEAPALAARLAPGMRVALFDDGGTAAVEEKEVAEVRREDDRGIVAWTRPVQGSGWTGATRAVVFARRLRLFGVNAPATTFTLSAAPSTITGVSWSQTTTSFAYPLTAAETSSTPGRSLLCLEGRVEGLEPGNRLLVADTRSGGIKRLVTVAAVDQVDDSLGGVSETVTRLAVTPFLSSFTDRRTVVVYELGAEVRLSPQRYATSFVPTTVYVPGRRFADAEGEAIHIGRRIEGGAFAGGVAIRPDQVELGRRVLLTDATGLVVAATVAAAPVILPGASIDSAFGHLAIDLDLEDGAAPLQTASAKLLGNVAPATHGETVSSETLGDADGARLFQRFPLRKEPLTYLPGTASPQPSSTLRVEVNGVRWSEAASLFGRGPAERVYVTRTAEDGATEVIFGDGGRGVVPPSGRGNVAATYRTGSGLAGRVGAGSLTTLLDRPLGLKEATNPLAATGGADPESLDDARRAAPGTVRTFGRAVSLRDFEDILTESGEVAKALATWVWDGLDRAVHVTVAGEAGAAFAPADLSRLGTALASVRDPNHRLTLANAARIRVEVAARLVTYPAYDPDEVAADAFDAVASWLSFDALELGRAIHLSDLYGVLSDVAGVVAADVDRFMFARPPGMSFPAFDAFLNGRGVARLPSGAPAPVQGHLRIFRARAKAGGGAAPAEIAWIASPTQDLEIAAGGAP